MKKDVDLSRALNYLRRGAGSGGPSVEQMVKMASDAIDPAVQPEDGIGDINIALTYAYQAINQLTWAGHYLARALALRNARDAAKRAKRKVRKKTRGIR